MAVLPDGDRQEIHAQVMRDFSRTRTQTPILKVELRALVNFMDAQLESAEAAIFSALPAGDGKDWLLANQSVGRELLARIERKRREVL